MLSFNKLKPKVYFKRKNDAMKKIETAIDILNLEVKKGDNIEIILEPHCQVAASKILQEIQVINSSSYG